MSTSTHILIAILFIDLIYGSMLYQEICGTKWQSAYTKFHNSVRSGSIPGRYLVSMPVQMGTADNVLGYVSQFIWALLSNRVYLILQTDLKQLDHHEVTYPFEGIMPKVSHAYHNSHINWTSPAIHENSYRCERPPYHIEEPCVDTVLHDFDKSSKPLNLKQVRLLHENKFSFADTNFQTIFNEKDDKDILLVLYNRGRSRQVFDNPLYNKTLIDLGFTKENIFPCVFHYLFKLNRNVCTGECKHIELQLRSYASTNHTITIAIHARHGDVNNTYADQHFKCADELSEYYKTQGKSTVIIAFSKYPHSVQKKYKPIYGDRLLLPYGESIQKLEIALNDRKRETRNSTTEVEVEEKNRKAMMNAAREFHLMSLTDIQIITHKSGFGVLGAMSKLTNQHRVFFVTDNMKKCSDTPLGHNPDDYVYEWSGLR